MGLVIDKLTGQVYLFNITGGGGSGSTATYSEVNLYSQLPAASSHNGEIYVVRQSSGTYMINRKEAGLYYSNGLTWTRLGDIPSFFNDDNFEIYDGTDNTRRVKFQLSGLTSNSLRTVTMRNSDGTMAYLTDLAVKLDKSVFNAYTAATNTRITNIETILAGLTGGSSTNLHAIQVVDLVGGINVNTVTPTSIQWTNVEFTGNSLNYTGASRIYIQTTGNYEITYNLVLKNGNNTAKTIGSVIRMNGTTNVTPMSVATYIDNGTSITGSNNIANYKKTFNAGDYLELQAFRIGTNGTVTTIPGASFIRVIKT